MFHTHILNSEPLFGWMMTMCYAYALQLKPLKLGLETWKRKRKDSDTNYKWYFFSRKILIRYCWTLTNGLLLMRRTPKNTNRKHKKTKNPQRCWKGKRRRAGCIALASLAVAAGSHVLPTCLLPDHPNSADSIVPYTLDHSKLHFFFYTQHNHERNWMQPLHHSLITFHWSW